MTHGTFPAAWGICFKYSSSCDESLRAAGIDTQDPALALPRTGSGKRSAQMGLGRAFSTVSRACTSPSARAGGHDERALLALAEIDPTSGSIHPGTALVQAMQTPEGSWPPEAVNGVFFGTAMLDYCLYRSYFPAWALARCAQL